MSHAPASCCTPSRGAGPGSPLALTPARTPASRRPDGPWDGMILLPGGEFLMGTDDREGFPDDGEGPVRRVRLDPFLIDARAVTNEQFAAFTAATGYRTEAERIGWSYVFAGFLPAALRRTAQRVERTPWWCAVTGAAWDRPEGPGSDLAGRADHPVVHVSWNDAHAYATWAASGCPPRRNGSTRPAADSTRPATRGATNSTPTAPTDATSGAAPSPPATPPPTAIAPPPP